VVVGRLVLVCLWSGCCIGVVVVFEVLLVGFEVI